MPRFIPYNTINKVHQLADDEEISIDAKNFCISFLYFLSEIDFDCEIVEPVVLKGVMEKEVILDWVPPAEKQKPKQKRKRRELTKQLRLYVFGTMEVMQYECDGKSDSAGNYIRGYINRDKYIGIDPVENQITIKRLIQNLHTHGAKVQATPVEGQ